MIDIVEKLRSGEDVIVSIKEQWMIADEIERLRKELEINQSGGNEAIKMMKQVMSEKAEVMEQLAECQHYARELRQALSEAARKLEFAGIHVAYKDVMKALSIPHDISARRSTNHEHQP